MAATVAENAKKIDILNKIVLGNGEPGMDENVRTIRRDLDTLIKQQQDKIERDRQREDERQRERRVHIWSIVILVVSNLITVIGYAAFWFIRYAPIIEQAAKGQ